MRPFGSHRAVDLGHRSSWARLALQALKFRAMAISNTFLATPCLDISKLDDGGGGDEKIIQTYDDDDDDDHDDDDDDE